MFRFRFMILALAVLALQTPAPAHAQSSGWTCAQIHEKCIDAVLQMGRTAAFAKSHCAGHLAQAIKGGVWPASTDPRNRHPPIPCAR